MTEQKMADDEEEIDEEESEEKSRERQELIKELVIARIKRISSNMRLSIG